MPKCGSSAFPICSPWHSPWRRSASCPRSCSEIAMNTLQDPHFGDKMVTLMAALVLVLQIAMVAQRWIVTNIRIFAAQSFCLAAIANTIAYFNHAPHIYAVAALTLLVKAILVPIALERLVAGVEIGQEIDHIL